MNFETVLTALKQGKSVKREMWDGSIRITEGSASQESRDTDDLESLDPFLFGLGDVGTIVRYPRIDYYDPNDSSISVYNLQVLDILANDWEIV